ncbi:T9SS type A sorting domain-containing protein [Psychroserpens sp. SPM9]|uniref:zinc-dependent metalloprotease n=1 Tax=Psychroserpens sp. SPM9 TaxID=2975598 RepID=UPI0021A6CEFA|nr:T9SS type A sorting domain-containing protein [Psychroserpens sp. SPM9]MDG5490835.1 M43 family zinc metalloprotease [Psychroserpens sp. SPM9]
MKKITLSKTLIFAFAFFMLGFTYAQDRTCGMVEYMEEQMKDPEFAKEYERTQAKFKAEVERRLSQEDFALRGGSTIVIPVAVHFPEANEADRDCLEALAQNQLDILNADYTATNSDFSQWNTAMSLYPNTTAGVANIEFCLAVSNHPTGLDPELLEGEPCITIGYNFGGGNNLDSNWAGYMNFVVRNIGALGFSPLGGSIAAGQAVTMDNNAFGSGAGCGSGASGVIPQAPYNLGRTVTHELGHFYNLNHTFNGDGNGVCGNGGDGIADTPEVANSTYGCPTTGSVASCTAGQAALTMNYMDYVNDACMYMFSAGQTNIVDAYVASIQSDFVTGVCAPASPGFNLAANNSPVFSCPSIDTQAVFNLTYTTVSGFTENTTFSAIGLPANATVAFSPTSVNSNGDFTMTVGNLGATTEGEYTITVTGTSSPGGVTESIDVLLKNTCTSIQCITYESAQNLDLPIDDGSGGNPGEILQHVLNIPDAAMIESVTINVEIEHTWISDLLVGVIPPGGTFPEDILTLWSGNCSVSSPPGVANFDITFDDEGIPLPGTDECSNNQTGTYIPTELLEAFSGIESQGDWTIVIADFFGGDTGVLKDWSVTVCAEAPLSTDEFTLDNFAIFPNPNKGEFTVKLDSNSGNAIAIDVHDIRGRRIFNNTYVNGSDFNQTVKLNSVQSGLYLVTVKDGDRQITKKIVVE